MLILTLYHLKENEILFLLLFPGYVVPALLLDLESLKHNSIKKMFKALQELFFISPKYDVQVFFHLFIFEGDEIFSTWCYTFSLSKLKATVAHHLSNEMAGQSKTLLQSFSKPKMGESTDLV